MGFGGGDSQRLVRDMIQELSQKAGKATRKIPMNNWTELGANPGILRKTSRFSCSFPATVFHFHGIGKSEMTSGSFKASRGQENEHSLHFPAPDSSQKVGKFNFAVWDDPFTFPTFLAGSQSCFLGILLLFLALIFHVCGIWKGKPFSKSDSGMNPAGAGDPF